VEDQPPFQSLQEINKNAEQLNISKMLNPSFKGQITSCNGVLPFKGGPLDERGTLNSAY